MAAAGDGRTATSSAYEGGGAGGKFRRRPFGRNKTTPYDRPPTSLRNPSWLTKLFIDPATKLITSGARRFFTSIFQKRLTPAPTPLPPRPEARQESKNVQQESCPNDHAGAVVATGHEVCNAAFSSEDSAFSELERLLKQKTFSRDEIDRLTELLRSKTVDTPAGNDKSAIAAPVTSSRVPKGNVASPAELSKSYMDTRPPNVSPTILSSQSQVVRVDTPLLKNVAYSQNSPITSVTTKPAGLVGVRANGFTTPRSRGRSAIYHMARTPYSRLRQTDGQMAISSTYNAYNRPSLSESVSEHDGYFGSKQPLKRRSSVLEDDIGSIGPIRRTRQKPNLLSHGISRPSPGAGVASTAADVPTKHVHIPSKPHETAAKILEHLDNLTPTEKSSELRPAVGNDKTPKKLSPNMLRGQALKSLESLDSPKVLEDAQDSHKLENWPKVVPANGHDSSLQKQGKTEQHQQNKSINGPIVVAKKNEKNSFEDVQHAQPDVGTADSLDKKSSVQPQKKHAFRMSALEDSFEMDEDVNFDKSVSQLAEGRDKMGISGTEKKSLSTDEALDKPAALSETNATLGIFNKRNDMVAPDAALISVSSPSFLPSSDPPSQEVVSPSSGSNKSMESSVDKVPALLFSSSFPLSGLKPESSSSLSNSAFGLACASSELFKTENSQKDGSDNGKLEPLSSGLSPSTLFAAPSSTSSFSNGQFAPSPAISSTSLLASSSSRKDVQSDSSSEVFHSTNISAAVGGSLFGFTAASSVPPIKSILSEVPPMVSTLSTASSADNSDLKTKAANLGNLSSNSPFPGSSFASTSSGNSIFGLSSSGTSTVTTVSVQSQSSVFSTGSQSLVSAQSSLTGSDNTRVSQSAPAHFGSSTTSPEVGNSGMISFSSVGSASSNTGVVSAAASDSNPVGSSAAAFGNFSFGASSSASSLMSSVSPSSGATQLAFTFGASPAVPAANTALATSSNATSAMFSFGANSSSSLAIAVDTSTCPSPSTFNFGGSSSASSLNNVSMSNSAASGVFSFGGGSSASSTNTISTPSNATPGTFSFGGSSSASSTNTVSTSSSATAAIFNFGASTSSLSTNTVSTSTSATPGIFSFGASSSVSSTNAVNASSTVNPSPFAFGASSASSQTPGAAGIFGSNWQAPKSPGFGSPFSSATPTGFAFGASSSSFTPSTTTAAVFGSVPSTPSGPAFPFGSTSLTKSSPQPIFGNSSSPFTATPGNNNQMSMEDSMAEDTMHASSPAVPFGQPSVSPSPGDFVFGSTPGMPTPGPFQFGGQQNQAAAATQNPSPFAASGSLGGGGSFSLGSNGPDKSGRKIVKVNRNKNRRK